MKAVIWAKKANGSPPNTRQDSQSCVQPLVQQAASFLGGYSAQGHQSVSVPIPHNPTCSGIARSSLLVLVVKIMKSAKLSRGT